MTEIASQSGFEGKAFKIGVKKTIDAAKPLLTGAEQIRLIDDQIRRERFKLRMITSGKIVRVPVHSGDIAGITDVYLKQNAIISMNPQKEHPKKFDYYARVPVVVASRKYGNFWTVPEDTRIVIDDIHADTRMKGKIRKLPKKLDNKDLDRLRSHTKLSS
jgi:hypothetical protein